MAAFETRARPMAAALLVTLAPSCALDDDRMLHPAEPSSDAGAAGDETLTASGSGGATATGHDSSSDAGGTSSDAGGASTSSTTGTLRPSECPDLNENDVPDCDETLAANATFDAGTEDWEAESRAAIRWEAADLESASSESSAGALVVTHDGTHDPDQLSMAGSFQCIPIQGKESYRFLAQSFIRAGYADAGSAISALFYASNDCSGSSLSVMNSAMQAGPGSWRVLHTAGVAPELARSARVRLVAIKAAADASVEVRFDNVLVIRE